MPTTGIVTSQALKDTRRDAVLGLFCPGGHLHGAALAFDADPGDPIDAALRNFNPERDDDRAQCHH